MFFSFYPHEIIVHSTPDVSLAPGGLQISTYVAYKTSDIYINVGFRTTNIDKKM